MNQLITSKTFDGERALYHLCDATVRDCIFSGPADGESALKESRRVVVERCHFDLRYPLWHAEDFRLADCEMTATARAALWYAQNGQVEGCTLNGIKCLRECQQVTLSHVRAVSPEFGWKCRGLVLRGCDIDSEYFLLGTRDADIERLCLEGKYSFQYAENITVKDAVLRTKDAFWHARNVRVENCTVEGEYLGWYSDGLTLVGCHITGTQPLCYCKNLTLIDCTMEGADLAFEYSEVEADLSGEVLSVKNPKSGHITADRIGEVILRDSVMPSACRLTQRDKKTD